MAEALAVVGIVANIIQLVDFGTRVLKRLEDYQSTLAEIPKAFRHIKAELPVLLDALRQTKVAIDAGLLQDESKRALLPAVEGCGVQVKVLNEVIDKALPALSDSWARRGRKALQSLQYDAKVEKITAVIRGYVQTLTYHAAASLRPSAGYVLSPLNPSSTVPFRRDPHFVDCKILTEIDGKSQRPASRVALVGLGGVGKSQLAVEYSYRVREKLPTTWVFWVYGGSTSRFIEGFRNIAERARIPDWDQPNVDILKLVYNWLCDEANGRWLMIIDNADDLSVFSPEGREGVEDGVAESKSADLLDSLPQSQNGSILITSRSREAAFRLTGTYADIIRVQPMDQEDSLSLLRNKLDGSFEQDDAAALVEALDYMPLAISQAAAYISQRAPRATVSRYLNDIRKGDQDRARLLDIDIKDSRRDGKASNSIMATWQISFEHIRRVRPSATQLLSLMSLFDRQGIPEYLLNGQYHHKKDSSSDFGEDASSDFEEDVNTLMSFGLITADIDGSQFEMHRLVQFSTKTWLELYDELEQWKERYATLLDENYPVGRHEHWTVCQALFPHAQTAVICQPKDAKALEAWTSILFKASQYASDMGQHEIAYSMGSTSFGIREGILGAEHPNTLSSLISLGVILHHQGKYNEAEAIQQRALETTSMACGDDHPLTLTSMGNLALTYGDQGRWNEAEKLQAKVMEISKKKLGVDHPDTLISMGNLASTYRNQGRWNEAEELQVQVVKINKKKLGVDHPSTLASMGNLALTYGDQGRWKEAEGLQVQVMEISRKKLGVDHFDTGTSMSNLALAYMHQGWWKEAKELQVQVIEISKKKLGVDHPDTLISMGNLASTYRNQGRWNEAEELQVQVVKISKKKLGVDHPSTLASMGNLALTYGDQGRWKEAEELQVQVMEISKKKLGVDHPETLTSMGNLALTYRDQGRWNEAKELQVQVVKINKKKLGVDHPSTLASMGNLALTYGDQGRWKEAEGLQVQVMEISKKKLGVGRPSTLISMDNLASTYEDQGRWKEAEELQVQVMEISRKKLGVDHPNTLISMANLAFTWKRQSRNVEAVDLMRECVQLRHRILGVSHPLYLSSSQALARWEAVQAEVSAPT